MRGSVGPGMEATASGLEQFRARHRPVRVEIGGICWEYLIGGQGPALLVLHGGGGTAESLWQHIAMLEHSFTVVAPTLPSALGTMAEAVHGLLAILDHASVDRVHLFGPSLGGMVAQCLAYRHPDRVRSLLLSHTLLPTPDYLPLLQRQLRMLRLLPSWLLMHLLRKRTAKRVHIHAAHLPAHEQDFWSRYIEQLYNGAVTKEMLASRTLLQIDYCRNWALGEGTPAPYRGPVLILESEGDELIHQPVRAALKQAYPHSRVRTFEGTGHLGGGLFSASQTVAWINEFMEEVEV